MDKGEQPRLACAGCLRRHLVRESPSERQVPWREVRALRTWAGSLGSAAPRLVAADAELRAVVVTALPGRPLHGRILAPAREREVFRRIGVLARRFHEASPPRPAPAGSGPAVAKADRHLEAARPHLTPGDEEFVCELIHQAEDLAPLE
ncbi:phosphotransferase [Streptomyces poriticola]|uniref:phosphotransferase n=1 Tax=Streptomyces poriticola TaxID=3120506 RepID=UPI002FCE1379